MPRVLTLLLFALSFAAAARGDDSYEPPLKPRRPELPSAIAGRSHPIDRILDHDLASRGRQPLPVVGDSAFVRRAYLDLIGVLPTPEETQRFLEDQTADKRARLVDSLLARDLDYAEHWLTFWNDLLRNDYAGTGFITGGRRQISKWLYAALAENKPYDQFVRELIAPPTPESAGFGEGIRWRGDVSAGQTVEIQFAQSVGQAFLGINLKCASCHDSFIDRWTLDQSYGLAAIYSTRPLEIHRCDKPEGRTATAAWLFPEIGQIDPQASQPERLRRLAELLTHRDNGRFSRTIVNRLWHRMMGRGIVHPTDSMQSRPWNEDLLDQLASDFVDHGYDLRWTLASIAKSQAYQSESEQQPDEAEEGAYEYAGPRTRRLTAEQFVDAVWQLTDTAPARYDAPILRGRGAATPADPQTARWIWSRADASAAPAGETVVFRKSWRLERAPALAVAAVTCDNSYLLFVNGQKAQQGDNWEAPDAIPLTSRLRAGENELLIVATNGGAGPNPAGLLCELRIVDEAGQATTIASGADWQWTSRTPNRNGKFDSPPDDWAPAAPVSQPQVWQSRIEAPFLAALALDPTAAGARVRASLVKSDFLMRTLGRPNREQIVSVRPEGLSTLEAIDLTNGEILADTLRRGAMKLAGDQPSPKLVDWLFWHALCRAPSDGERSLASELLGERPTPAAVEDLLWSVLMLPEFQWVR